MWGVGVGADPYLVVPIIAYKWTEIKINSSFQIVVNKIFKDSTCYKELKSTTVSWHLYTFLFLHHCRYAVVFLTCFALTYTYQKCAKCYHLFLPVQQWNEMPGIHMHKSGFCRYVFFKMWVDNISRVDIIFLRTSAAWSFIVKREQSIYLKKYFTIQAERAENKPYNIYDWQKVESILKRCKQSFAFWDKQENGRTEATGFHTCP